MIFNNQENAISKQDLQKLAKTLKVIELLCLNFRQKSTRWELYGKNSKLLTRKISCDKIIYGEQFAL